MAARVNEAAAAPSLTDHLVDLGWVLLIRETLEISEGKARALRAMLREPGRSIGVTSLGDGDAARGRRYAADLRAVMGELDIGVALVSHEDGQAWAISPRCAREIEGAIATANRLDGPAEGVGLRLVSPPTPSLPPTPPTGEGDVLIAADRMAGAFELLGALSPLARAMTRAGWTVSLAAEDGDAEALSFSAQRRTA